MNQLETSSRLISLKITRGKIALLIKLKLPTMRALLKKANVAQSVEQLIRNLLYIIKNHQ